MATSATQWVPGANGSMVLQSGSTTLMTITSAGLLTFGAAATTGAMVIQSMTTTQRDALSAPAAGTIIYNSSTNKLNVRVAAAWEAVTSA